MRGPAAAVLEGLVLSVVHSAGRILHTRRRKSSHLS